MEGILSNLAEMYCRSVQEFKLTRFDFIERSVLSPELTGKSRVCIAVKIKGY